MKVLIVDDEAPARARLRRLLGELEDCEVVGECAGGREALDANQRLRPDVVLLDIRMPDMDGLEAAEHLAQEETPPAVVFVTAYADHALDAFRRHAVDYLLKPVRAEALREALAAARRRTRAQLVALREAAGRRRHLGVRHRGKLLSIPIEDVYYLRAEDKYVTVRHRGGIALSEESLSRLERDFGEALLRVHRKALVGRDHVAALERAGSGWCVRLRDVDETVAVSRRHLAAVRRRLLGETH